jgi:iron complex outermembrane recepter protein
MNIHVNISNHLAPSKHTPIALACAQLIALSAFSSAAQAQQPPVLESIVITGQQSPDALVKPFSLIDQDTLNSKGASSIGEALRYEQGMDTTGFGPNASRPIVRGQDSDRIKILRNSASTVDVSALSFDHGVPVDPFSLTQVEVLRGPSSLAYGGNAVGGAVNLVDSRIARERVIGINGEINALTGGAAEQSAGGFALNAGFGAGAGEVGGKGISLHLDGFRRTTGDLRTPEFTDPEGVTGKRVRNSSSKSSGAGFGASLDTGNGYVGVSVEQYNSNYGVPKSTDVRIDQASERYALEGEQKFAAGIKPSGILSSVKYRLAHTDYQHQEFEDGEAATLFSNRGLDGRLELGHAPFQAGPLSIDGTLGIQFENTDFSAVGDEAFVPSTSTHHTGLFYVLKAKGKAESDGVIELGLRTERVKIDAASTGLSPAGGQVVGLGVADGPAASRSFTPGSVSLGYTKPLDGMLGQSWAKGWSVGGSLSRVQRAPSAFELFADGEHVATDAYEKGNPALKEERARHFELSAKWTGKGLATSSGAGSKSGFSSTFSATVFKSQFSNYITLIARENETFNNTPVFDFTAVPADFQGLEVTYQRTVENSLGKWKPGIQFDSVKAERTDGGGNLPRISPQRVLASLEYSRKGWAVRPEVIWVADSKGAVGDPVTEAYQLVNLRVAKTFSAGVQAGPAVAGEFFANFANLTDELAYSASTISTVRNYTPLQGRSVLAGVKFLF